jgi:hypothetical protein
MQGPGFRKITLFFLLLGSSILTYYKLPFIIWMQSLVSMTNVIAIIVVMQLFSLPITLGQYSNTIEFWLQKSFNKESSLFVFAMLVTNIFSSFLMFGTVPVMVSLFSKALKNNIPNYQRFLATAIVRGYSLVLLWAPGAIIILLVLQVTEISWLELFFPGVLLSLLGLVSAYGFEHFTRLNKPILTAPTHAAAPEKAHLAYKQSIHIILVVLGLLLTVSCFELFSVGSGTGRILLSGLTIASLWLFYYRRHPRLSYAFEQYWESGIIKATDFSVFFIAMGLFAGSIDKSGILTAIQPMLQTGVNQLGLLSVIAVPILYILLSLTGIHPLILTVILGKILMSVSLPLPTVSIALLLLLSGSISFIVSPFAGMVLMTAKFQNVKPIEVSVKWNATFGVLFLVEGIVFACLWH